MDINSSYPNEMVNSYFTTELEEKICITTRNFYE